MQGHYFVLKRRGLELHCFNSIAVARRRIHCSLKAVVDLKFESKDLSPGYMQVQKVEQYFFCHFY